MKHTALVLVGLFLCSAFSFGQTLQKGEFTSSVNSEGWSLATGTGDRTFIEFISFDKPFDAPPTVLVTLAGCDAATDEQGTVRIHLAVDKITKVGCIVKIKTWGNSKLNAVYGSYLAFAK